MNTTKDRNKSIIEEFRANEGKVGGYFKNSTLLLLHTTGAKSGKARINPLMYLKVRDRFLVIASNKGGETNPAWYYNIVANPDVAVEVGTEKFEAVATVLKEPERSQLFKKMVAAHSGFGDYEQKTTRKFPAIILTRKE